jgi:hypothetical protein
LEEPGVDVIDLQEMGCGAGAGFIRLRLWTSSGVLKLGNEFSGSIKFGEFLD